MSFDRVATELAAAHKALSRRDSVRPPLFDPGRLAASIATAARGFRVARPEDLRYQKAGEWFLDNHYLLSRTLRQIRTEIPAGFRRRLLYVGSDPRPRVLILAETLVETTSLNLDEAALLAFVDAYQAQAPLTIAELWALPAMLRIAALESLARALGSLFPSGHAPAKGWERALEVDVILERVVRVLRLLADMDWKAIVTRTSAVDATLREDPARVYARMDFESRDAYRKKVESLAWETERPEPDVAQVAVSLAREARDAGPDGDPRAHHVGYYLLDRGLPELKRRIAHRARGKDRLREAVTSRPTLAYLGGIGVLTLLPLTAIVYASVPTLLAIASIVPLSSIAVAIVNWSTTRLLPPRPLPRLDFTRGIPADCKTAVVIPALVARAEDFDGLLAEMERHYLSCPDPSLVFILLTDHVDSPTLPDDTDLVASADSSLRKLNEQYARSTGLSPFFVMHREAKWSDGESCFMGWERKRGKLEELNRFLRGDKNTTFKHVLGDSPALDGIRFVITLDADTQLPIGATQKLVGLAAHPLNTAHFDERTGRVTSGYTVAQPRLAASPAEGATSRFSRTAAGDTALDIYSHAASDVYQDLFGSGMYVGKGIYEVDAFMRSVDGRVPPDRLASHDLFEGIHGRAALASDIVLFEQYPDSYLSFARRTHRWIRGDWQLLPWLFPTVPSTGAKRLPNTLSAIDRWKIIDNLRRSLLAPSLVAAFLIAWLELPRSAAAFALVPLVVPLVILAPALLNGGGERARVLGRWLLGVMLLPHEAWVAGDAIVRTLVRLTITKRRMLEWVTAAAAARAYADGSRKLFWREMGPAVLATTAACVALGIARPTTLAFTLPVICLWLVSPEVARWVSAPDGPREPLSRPHRAELRRLARRTWLFFETFAGPANQWLAPDNFQQTPGPVVAHRTSPTNIGLMLVADLAAYDFGYIGPSELCALVNQSLATLARLERYRGHWLNWYDTQSLEPLLPRYVSTVDSGNLAAALVTLAKGCREAADTPALRPVRFQGLGDTLDLLEESIDRLAVPHRGITETIASIRAVLTRPHGPSAESFAAVRALSTVHVPTLEKALVAMLDQTTTHREVAMLREVQTWLDRLRHQMRSMLTDIEPSGRAAGAREELLAVAESVDAMRAEIDFTFLYDQNRKLFHIGYNATSDRLDAHHYDLLASEARVASFLAIVENQVPPEHWLTLGRPIARIHGGAALVSWGGTMFEYLMPALFMRSRPGTLLYQSGDLAVAAQIDHGKMSRQPWGVSESGFAQLDAQNNYQYRSFGAPGLGLRRGLEEDRVIAPYACVLALPFRPKEVISNLVELRRLGAEGLYGLFEAVDYDESRAIELSSSLGEPPGRCAVVRSHMAHHQGMILAALDNAINDDVLVERFHANALVKTGEMLLSERLPSVRLAEELARTAKTVTNAPASAPDFPAWSPGRDAPDVAFLGNGRLKTVVSDTGAGCTTWSGLAVTRGGVDPTCDADGTWIYLRDEVSNRVWSAAPGPMRARLPTDEVLFHAHQVDIHHRDQGISVRTEIAIDAVDDVEVRHVSLHNETAEARTLTVMTFSEPVLEPAAAAARQPAFSRLFVSCEVFPERHGVLASRRPRSPDDASGVMFQSVVWRDRAVSWLGAETDRRAFLGRRRDARTAECVLRRAGQIDGPTLDPAVVLAVRVELAPHARVDLALVTAVAKTRDAVLELARRFGSLHAARWVAADSRRELARRLDREGMSPALFPHAMRLVSRLLLPTAGLRAAPPTLDARHPRRDSLWGHGISGDDPLLVVRIHERGHESLVRDVLAAHRYLRTSGPRAEVVFLDEGSSSYQADEPGSVRSIVIKAGADALLNQRGGVFVLATDQLGADDRSRICQAAHVMLDSQRGSLAEQLARASASAPLLPAFLATHAPERGPVVALAAPELIFANHYGGFTKDGREYVVTATAGNPTPAPWCNVLANAEAGCLVSESSLDATWVENSGENRLTPWRNDPVTDAPSEAVYLRDEETAEVWSPTPLPAGLDADVLVRHGAGYTTYERESHGMRQELTVFVPTDAPVKILTLKLVNRLDRSRRLTATYYVEWVLGVLREQERTHIICEADTGEHCLFARSGWSPDSANKVAFVSADRPMHGFTFDRTEFLGRSGSLARPEALGRWGLSGSSGNGVDPCAALQTHVDLPPGSSVEIHFVLGQGRDRAHATELARRFRPAEEVTTALGRVHAYWDRLLGAVQVKTPEPAMNLLLNRWLLYQSLSCRLLARTAFYQSSGAFGYRDQLQDVMALTYAAPELARAHILTSAAHQFEEGDVLHWWHPPADRGVRTRCSDDLAWLPFVTAHYVETTGDTSILDEAVSFLTAPALKPDEHDRYAKFPVATKSAPLFEHCRRALQRATTEGEHGLPLMGDSDWNDGMNRVGSGGRGESVWLAFFLASTMQAFGRLCDRRGGADEAERWREKATALGASVDAAAWDGAWYMRAFYDDGTPMGRAQDRECRIDSIAQSWAVLSGVVDPTRARQAIRSADQLLVRESERIVKVLDPPFDRGRHDPGYIRAYPPGVRENGGQYTHAATWLGFAHAAAGNGDAAERIFRLLSPVLHAVSREDADKYRIEPYVLAGDVYGDAPFVGRGGWSWYTGAASWMWRLGVEAILGLTCENGALRIDPCVPPRWPGFEATVRLGEQMCHIVVDNANGIGRGVESMTVDGVAVSSQVVTPRAGSEICEVRIVLAAVAKAAE